MGLQLAAHVGCSRGLALALAWARPARWEMAPSGRGHPRALRACQPLSQPEGGVCLESQGANSNTSRCGRRPLHQQPPPLWGHSPRAPTSSARSSNWRIVSEETVKAPAGGKAGHLWDMQHPMPCTVTGTHAGGPVVRRLAALSFQMPSSRHRAAPGELRLPHRSTPSQLVWGRAPSLCALLPARPPRLPPPYSSSRA